MGNPTVGLDDRWPVPMVRRTVGLFGYSSSSSIAVLPLTSARLPDSSDAR